MSAKDNARATFACGLAEEVVRTFGELRLRVSGTSMAPTILPGDLISIQCAQMNEISTGEIVVFSRNGRLVVHRVIERSQDSEKAFTETVGDDPRMITRGDRLRHNDSQILPSELLGRVTSVERGGKDIDFTAKKRGWMPMLTHLLKTSDYATYFYVRLANFRQVLFCRRAEC